MKNLSAIARPYAKAVLDLAQQNKDYAVWSSMLEFLCKLFSDPQIINLINNHQISASEKANIICSVKPEALNNLGNNLVKLLASNKRLLIIPELHKIYEIMRQQAEQETNLKLITAEKMSKIEIDKLIASINKKFSGKTKITSEIDSNLIGGGKIKIGDRVIDSSVKSRLQNLHKHLAKQ